MKFNIQKKVAVITGGDSGIGFATAQLLAAEGAVIVLADKEQDSVSEAAEKLKGEFPDAEVLALSCDLDNNESVVAFADQVKSHFGGAHILINCAGARGAAGDFLTLTDEDWMNTINTDLMGAVRLCRAFIPQLQERGWGRVVLIASENAYQPYEEESPYNACKAGIINLSKCLSRSYSKEGLLFNCVSPAYVESPMTNAMMDELAKQRGTDRHEAVKWFLANERPHIAVGRRGKPEEVAAVIAFLSSDLCSYVNGSNYRVDGGAVESAF